MESDKKAIIEDMETEETEPKKTITFSWTHLVIVPVIFLLFLGVGMFTIISEEWVRATVRKQYFPNTKIRSNFSTCDIVNKTSQDYKNYKLAQQKSASWVMYYRYGDNIPALVTSLAIPSYSDSFGRKKVLMVTMLGLSVWVCGTTIVMYAEAGLYWLVIMYVVRGLTGSIHGLAAVAFSYVADITSGDKQRVQGIILMDFTFIFSGLVASPLSGVLVQTLGLGFPNTGAFCGSSTVLAMALATLFLPETLPKTKRLPIRTPTAAMKQAVAFFVSKDFKNNKLPRIVLLLAFFFNELSASNRSSLEILYLLGRPFCRGPAYIGFYILVQRGTTGILGLAAVKVMLRYLSSGTVCIISCFSNVASFVMEALARTDAVMYCSPVVGLLGFLIFPLVRGMMSTITSPENQGAMFASLGAVQAVGSLTAVLENEIYAATLSFMNGFVFLCLAMLVAVETVLLLVYRRIQPDRKAVVLN